MCVCVQIAGALGFLETPPSALLKGKMPELSFSFKGNSYNLSCSFSDVEMIGKFN